MKTYKRILAGAVLAAGGVCSAPVHAATTTWIVDTLAPGAADANVGDGICRTAANECSLRAALEEANALPALAGDDVRIEIATGLTGESIYNGSTPRMHNDAMGVRPDVLGYGAYLHVNAARPVTVDLGNRFWPVQHGDDGYAMFYVQSDDVVIENFKNDAKRDIAAGNGYADTAGIEAAEAAIVISGSRVAIRNGLSSDPGTTAMETCIGLLDGASNVLIQDYYCRSPFRYGVFVDGQATVSNVVINRWESQGTEDRGDIYLWEGQGGETGIKTTVNGMSITDSEFRSTAAHGTDYTIGLLPNSVLNNLVITNSRFIGADAYGIGIYPSAVMNGLIVQNSTIEGTSQFIRDDGRTLQAGMTIRNNIFRSVRDDAIILNSPRQDTLIENNQFLNLRGGGNVAGVRVEPIGTGSNNVIRSNLFDQTADGEPNRFAVWMRAGSDRDSSSGWSIENNIVRNIFGSAYGPIFNEGDAKTLISGNTFGEGTRGAAINDPAPENDDSFFVVNADQYSNYKIQPWRPTGAVYTGTTVRVAVAPVAELRPGNTEPVQPVSIDVYYTASDKAEVYLGRIPGTHSSETVFEFTSSATGGAVRAQITDAQDRSSQYSVAVEVVQGLDSGADDDQDGLPNGAECTINLLGIPLLCRDSDGDGDPDYLDNDDDNDGIPTRVECPTGSPCVDTDGDGDGNHLDLDSDADGISDKDECPSQACRNTDGDGAANYVDTDSDGDGFEDAVECPDGAPCLDADGNDVEDYLELPGTLDVRGTGAGAVGPWLLMLLGGLALLRRNASLAALIGLIFSFGAQAADSGDWTSRFYGGAKVGALFTDFDEAGLTRVLQAHGSNVDRIESDSDGVGYGAWLGYALSSHWGVELSYTTGADERASFSGAVGRDLDAALDVASPYLTGYGDSYLAHLRYNHALSERWFLAPRIGVGITQTRQTFRNRDRVAKLEDDTFTWAAGGAVQYALTRNWSVGVSADWYQGDSDNGYGLVSGLVEWRVPSAFGSPSTAIAVTETITPVEAVPVPVRVVPAGAEQLGAVYFKVDSAVLSDEARAQLDLLIPMLQGQSRIEVAGHTDATGTEAHNLQLSQMRAQAVVDHLIAAGIDRSALNAAGYESSRPVASNDDEEGRSRNRRGEVWVGIPAQTP